MDAAEYPESDCSKGEAVATILSVDGRQTIGVGIVGTRKCIAICGYPGEPDEAESLANAQRIADDWNRHCETD